MAELLANTLQYKIVDRTNSSVGILGLLIRKPDLPYVWAHDSRRPVPIYQLPLTQVEAHIQSGRDDGSKPVKEICVEIEPGDRLAIVTYMSSLGLISSYALGPGFISANKDVKLISEPDLIQKAKNMLAIYQAVQYFNSHY